MNESQFKEFYSNLFASVFFLPNGDKKPGIIDAYQLVTDGFSFSQLNVDIGAFVKDGLIKATPGTNRLDTRLRFTKIEILPKGEDFVFSTPPENPWCSRSNAEFYIPWLRRQVAPESTESDWKILAQWFLNAERIGNLKFAFSVNIAMHLQGDINRRNFNQLIKRLGEKIVHLEYVQKEDKTGQEEWIFLSAPYWILAQRDVSPLKTAESYFDKLNLLISYLDSQTYLSEDKFITGLSKILKSPIPLIDHLVPILYHDLSITRLLTYQIAKPQNHIQLDSSPINQTFQEWIINFNKRWFTKSELTKTEQAYPSSISFPTLSPNAPLEPISESQNNVFFRETELSANIKSPFCFVIMPFSEKEFPQFIFSQIIRPFIESTFDINCYRSDDDRSPIKVDNKIYTMIKKSEFVIAEVTTGNRNVMYELGLAHMNNKRALILTQNSHEELPFDISTIHAESYRNASELIEKIESGISSLNTKQKEENQANLDLKTAIQNGALKLKEKKSIYYFLLKVFENMPFAG